MQLICVRTSDYIFTKWGSHYFPHIYPIILFTMFIHFLCTSFRSTNHAQIYMHRNYKLPVSSLSSWKWSFRALIYFYIQTYFRSAIFQNASTITVLAGVIDCFVEDIIHCWNKSCGSYRFPDTRWVFSFVSTVYFWDPKNHVFLL